MQRGKKTVPCGGLLSAVRGLLCGLRDHRRSPLGLSSCCQSGGKRLTPTAGPGRVTWSRGVLGPVTRGG